jgi:hypothetical protein
MSDKRERPEAADEHPPKQPQYQTVERTWLSPDDDDPDREEAAERARKAVESDRPRE